MEATIETQVTAVLKLNNEEAQWLRAVMRDPSSLGKHEETAYSRKMRENFYVALSPEQETMARNDGPPEHTIRGQVMSLIRKFSKGASLTDIREHLPDLSAKQLSNALDVLRRNGQVKTIARGVYAAT